MATKELNETTQLVDILGNDLNIESTEMVSQEVAPQATAENTPEQKSELDELLCDDFEPMTPVAKKFKAPKDTTPKVAKQGVWREMTMGGVKGLAFGVASVAASVGVAAGMSASNDAKVILKDDLNDAGLSAIDDETIVDFESDNLIEDANVDLAEIGTIEENLDFLSTVLGVEVPDEISAESIHADMINSSSDDSISSIEPIDLDDLFGSSSEASSLTFADDFTTAVDYTLSSSAVIASVNNDASFGDAFEAAREQVGAGGVFEWRGNLYNTFHIEEWDTLTSGDKSNFTSNVKIDEEYSAANNVVSDTVNYADNDSSVVDFYDGISDDDVQIISQEAGYEEEYIAAEPSEDSYFVDVDNSAHLGLTEDMAEDVVIASNEVVFDQVMCDDGTFASVAYATVDGEDVIAVDYDQDGVADVLIRDVNGDGDHTEDEYFDISGQEVTMADFGTDSSSSESGYGNQIAYNDTDMDYIDSTLRSDDQELLADFNNDADISDFIA